MALPNVRAVQQADVDPLEIQKKQNTDQKIAEILDNITSRLGSITNVRSNVQSSVFDAFGNNFISRSISQTMDAVADSFKTLIVGKKEEKDPILENSKQQLQLLTSINATVGHSDRTLTLMDDSIIGIRQDIKNIFEKQRGEANAAKPVTPATPDNGMPGITDFPPIFTPPSTEFYDINSFPRLENEPSPTLEPSPPEIRVPVGAGPTERTPPPAAVREPGEASYSPQEERHDARTEQILDDILSVMTQTNTNLDLLLRDVPLSTAETEMESAPNRQTLASRVEDPSAVEDAPPPGSNKFDWTRLITGWFDFDANLRGMVNVIKMVTGGLQKVFSFIANVTGRLLPAIGTIAAAAAPLAAMYGVTKWAESASITDENGELTTTGEVLDTVHQAVGGQSIKPATKVMTSAERIAESADTGWWDITGSKKEAQKKRYAEQLSLGAEFSKEEAEALKKHFDLDVPTKQIKKQVVTDQAGLNKAVEPRIEEINKKQKEIAGKEKAPVAAPAMNVNNSSVVNNQTVMPTRTIVKNPDDSYNNYVNSVLR